MLSILLICIDRSSPFSFRLAYIFAVIAIDVPSKKLFFFCPFNTEYATTMLPPTSYSHYLTPIAFHLFICILCY